MTAAGKTNLSIAGSLLLMNVFLAINQTNIASLNLPISLEFHQTLYGLGVLSSSCFVAYGLFELPGGLLAFRVGAKRLLVLGGLVTSASVLVSSVSPTFDTLIALRFLVGIGLGLTFPPTIVLVIRNLKAGSTGLGAALVLASFSLGGGTGVLGWAILSSLLGWRESLLVAGALCLFSTLLVTWLLPTDVPLGSRIDGLGSFRRVMFDRQFLVLGVSFVGAGGAAALVGNFMVYYLEQHLGLQAETAGIIGGLTYVLPLLTSPFFGSLYDKGRDERLILVFGASLLVLGVCSVSLDSVGAAIFSVLVAGLATGVFFTVGFSAVRDRSPTREMESFTVGLVDSFSLIGFIAAPLYFSMLVLSYGYPTAWFAGGVISLALVLPLVFLTRRKTASQTASGVISEAPSPPPDARR
jgi:MFS family permease